jgi:hypothetical protein
MTTPRKPVRPATASPASRTAAQRPAAPAQPAKKQAARPAVTETEKAHQRALAKIKRLNMKLSKIKGIAVNMESIANRSNEVSARQVEDWGKKINTILNGDS